MKMMMTGPRIPGTYWNGWRRTQNLHFYLYQLYGTTFATSSACAFDCCLCRTTYHPGEEYLFTDPKVARTLFEPRNGFKELTVINALYDGEIRYLDEKYGCYERLAKLNVLDNTVIIITSDHGDNLGIIILSGMGMIA